MSKQPPQRDPAFQQIQQLNREVARLKANRFDLVGLDDVVYRVRLADTYVELTAPDGARTYVWVNAAGKLTGGTTPPA